MLSNNANTAQLDSTDGGSTEQKSTTNAAWTLEKGQIGGERNTASSTNNYDVVKHEANSTILDTVITEQAVSASAPAYLLGVHAHTALAGTLTIKGFTNVAGTATDLIFPLGSVGALLPAGTARRCEVALTATLSSALDYGRVIIDWRPI